MDVVQIEYDDRDYPVGLENKPSLSAIGSIDVLQHLHESSLALFCSVKCPGSIILKTHDLAQDLRVQGTTVISGFHSPVEQECLRVLLRGKGQIILCPARSITGGMRIPAEYKTPLAAGRLVILSPFGVNDYRVTTKTADVRNQFVAMLASRVFVAYAEPDGKTERFCRGLIAQGKPLYTFESEVTANLREMGAQVQNSSENRV